MEELYLMLESKSPIIPVFYKVKPGALRRTLRRTQDQNIHEKWRKALKSATLISGFELKELNDDEGELLDQVVECVSKNLKRDLYVADYPVGLDEKAQVFQWRVLSQKPSGRVQVVGIAGPPGVGKTTLAKQLFNIQSSNYENRCFLVDVRTYKKSCLPSLQRKLLKGLIKLDQDIDNVDEGKWMLKKHLSKFPVLIVLDDVDDEGHVNALLPVNDLHPESLILITSRDRIVLARSGIQSICQLTGLDPRDSRKLFCFYAFHQPHPPSEFESLVDQFLQACNRLPLCLIVFGGLVFRNNKKSYWEDQLKILKQKLGIPKRIQIGCDALGEALNIWSGSGILGNTTGMHDQLTDLGRYLKKHPDLRKDFEQHPELLSLLWRRIEDIHDLKHMTITRSLKKMVLKLVIEDDTMKRRAVMMIAAVEGVDFVSVDMRKNKIILIGDPVFITVKLRSFGFTELLSIGPVIVTEEKIVWL